MKRRDADKPRPGMGGDMRTGHGRGATEIERIYEYEEIGKAKYYFLKGLISSHLDVMRECF